MCWKILAWVIFVLLDNRLPFHHGHRYNFVWCIVSVVPLGLENWYPFFCHGLDSLFQTSGGMTFVAGSSWLEQWKMNLNWIDVKDFYQWKAILIWTLCWHPICTCKVSGCLACSGSIVSLVNLAAMLFSSDKRVEGGGGKVAWWVSTLKYSSTAGYWVMSHTWCLKILMKKTSVFIS